MWFGHRFTRSQGSVFPLQARAMLFALLVLGPIVRASSPEAANVIRLEEAVEQNPQDLDLQYQLGLAYNDFAMLAEKDENEAALEQAMTTFQKIYEQDPSRLEAKAMLGSATVLKARFVSIFTKIRWAEKGFVIIDEAVAAAPDNADLRLIRAANSAQVPGFLGRSDEADEDFAWLLTEIERAPERYSDNMRRSIYFYAGEYALKNDDESAVELLHKAQATPGEARLDHRIVETLAKARKQFPQASSPSES